MPSRSNQKGKSRRLSQQEVAAEFKRREEEALQKALSNKKDPAKEFNKLFKGGPFENLHRRARKVLEIKPDLLHVLIIHQDRWVRGVAEWKPKGKSRDAIARSLITHLICSYPMPVFWYSVWFANYRFDENHYDPENTNILLQDILLFVEVAQGASLYQKVQDEEFAPPLTKKQCHLFRQQTADKTVPQAVRWTQIESMGGTRRLAEVIASSDWGESLGHIRSVEEFRSGILQWLSNQGMLDPAQIGPMIDYFSRAQRPAGWRIQGRTVRSVMRAMEQWHAELAANRPQNARFNRAMKAVKPPPKTWKGLGLAEWSFEQKARKKGKSSKEYWEIVEITSYLELCEEGKHMAHCVSSYVHSAARGSVSIWSLKCNGIRELTVEVRNPTKAVVQARGRLNKLPTSQQVNIMRRWANANNLLVTNRALAGW